MFDKPYVLRYGRLMMHEMFFEDIEIIYDLNIFQYSELLESLRLEHEMHDATSDVFVFEYYSSQ